MTFIITLILLIALFLFLIFPSGIKGKSFFNNYKFIAHRGLHNEEIPENSLQSFKEAVKNGYAFENDIHILSDNNIDVGVLNLSTPLELDKEKVLQAAKTGFVLTYEDHIVHSGIAGSVAKLILENNISCKFVAKGVTKYGSSTSPDNLYKEQGLDADSVAKEIIGFLKA